MNHSGNVLAFIGDAVLSLQVRQYLIEKGLTKTKELQETSILFVSAKAQANFIQYLIDQEVLTSLEINVFKRGRNAKVQTIAKNTDVMTYKISTGFEAVWGYLHLNKEHERLEYLWNLYKERVIINE